MRTLGKYKLIAEIGRGGMANVFLATTDEEQLVVVKEPRLDVGDDKELLAMFLEEARLSLGLNHPNVVKTYEVGDHGGRHFIVMEYLEGHPLSRVRSRLARDRDFIPGMLSILCSMLRGLDYAHNATDGKGDPLELVHRDATPQNIFVTYDGDVKLVDFGIAKAQGSSVQTRTGVLKGKLKYMPPEQVANRKLDRRADVYAAGVILWETLTRSRLFRGLNDAALLHRVASGQIPSVYELNPDAPRQLVNIANRALAKNRDERYPTAAAMVADLDEYVGRHQLAFERNDLRIAMGRLFTNERQAMQGTVQNHLHDMRTSKASLPVIMPGESPSMTPPSAHTDMASTDGVLYETAAARRKRTISTVLAIGASAAVAAAISMKLRDQPSAAAPPPATAAAAAPPPAKAPPEEETVHLEVKVDPPKAEVFLDGALISQGTFTGEIPKSGKVRRLEVRADGYAARVAMIEVNRDLNLSFALSKRIDGVLPTPQVVRPRPRPKAPKTEEAPPAPTPKPKSEFVKKPKPSGGKAIDSSNPYQ